METIGKIRRLRRADQLSVSEFARWLSDSRNTVAKYLEGVCDASQPTGARQHAEQQYFRQAYRVAAIVDQDDLMSASEMFDGLLRLFRNKLNNLDDH